jgi:hypothetical protein
MCAPIKENRKKGEKESMTSLQNKNQEENLKARSI